MLFFVRSLDSKPRMKVTFAYSPENDDELTLEVGDIIEVIKEVSLEGLTIFFKKTLFCMQN